jgi:hypothetical protein
MAPQQTRPNGKSEAFFQKRILKRGADYSFATEYCNSTLASQPNNLTLATE